jgi:hypothetical protein
MSEATKSIENGGRSALRRTTRNTGSASTQSTSNSLANAGTTAPDSGDRRFEDPAGDRPSAVGQSGDSGFVGRVRERASAQFTTQKDRATDGLGTIAEAVRKTTQELRRDKHDTAAEYVERAADGLERVSRHLKGKDLGELFRDATNFARRRPVMFVGSAFALGLVTARFLKSSPSGASSTTPAWQRMGAIAEGSAGNRSVGSTTGQAPASPSSAASLSVTPADTRSDLSMHHGADPDTERV